MPLDLARIVATALDVKSETKIRAIDRALTAYARLTPQAPTVPIGGTIAASQVVSGTFADARIAQSNVTQHEAAIDHDVLVNSVAAEHIDWSVTGAEDVHADRIAEASVTQHEAAIDITESQISDLQAYAVYSTGTFTVGLSTGTGSITLSVATLRYVRLGDLVFIFGQLTVGSVSSPTGDVTMTGLPFTVEGDAALATIGTFSPDGVTTARMRDGYDRTSGPGPFANHIAGGTSIQVTGFYYAVP